MPWARIAIGKLKAELRDWGKTIHPDKVQHMSPRAVRLARQTHYALKYLFGTYARLTYPHSPGPDVAPVAADCPACGSDAFAALAGTTLDAFTQPDPEDEDVEEGQQGAENGNVGDDWGPWGPDGDRDGGDSVPLPNGDLLSTLGVVRALDLEDFALSPVKTVDCVPVQV